MWKASPRRQGEAMGGLGRNSPVKALNTRPSRFQDTVYIACTAVLCGVLSSLWSFSQQGFFLGDLAVVHHASQGEVDSHAWL